ncbi:L-threonine O-3-phosphate decarboxylase [Butyrivibrio proteoclasticus]|uniref:Aminotransferase n=1 Tax=Butyrivibrio proteoclasticus TaxID=43305 RepID=A0A1I5QD23_9FIRM|nr:aminotransferase class I/II-fold pyridoxal phosphate-dependent enzyme [Butyrivibrio proteoclasticus]SFP44198.1 L-threonine O-3-phosphate decarboxylase [Butyrivibrio proteoclasticus]
MEENKDYYHGGEIKSDSLIDFSVNTNFFVNEIEFTKKEIQEATSFYPDRESKELVRKVAGKNNISPDHIVMGNGASQIITLLPFCIDIENALIIEPTFSGYERALQAKGAKVKYLFLDEKDDFSFGESRVKEIERFVKEFKNHGNSAVYICSPNNPTGKVIKKDTLKDVLDICKKYGAFLVVDESFIDFADDERDKSLVCFIDEYKNLFIIRSFTKIYSIPGIRLGYGICSDEKVIEKMRLLQPEWSISGLAQIAGAKLLDSDFEIEKSLMDIKNEREYLERELERLGIRVFPSDVNFILIKVNAEGGFYDNLLRKGIYLRKSSNFPGLTDEYYRIAIRGHEDNKKLIEVIEKLI